MREEEAGEGGQFHEGEEAHDILLRDAVELQTLEFGEDDRRCREVHGQWLHRVCADREAAKLLPCDHRDQFLALNGRLKTTEGTHTFPEGQGWSSWKNGHTGS